MRQRRRERREKRGERERSMSYSFFVKSVGNDERNVGKAQGDTFKRMQRGK
jgi:hypothetical protein